MKKSTIITLIAFVFFLAAGFQSAHATAKLKLSDGVTEIIIVDGDENDTVSDNGGVGYTGGIGNFFLNITTAATYPALGSTIYPYMDVHSTDISSLTGGLLTISFTQVGYNEIRTPEVLMMVGGTSQGTLSFNAYIDNDNTEFGTGTLVGSLGPYGTGSYNGNTTWDVITPSDPFSMTAVATIAHSTGTNTSGFQMTMVAPEPISSVLFIVGGSAMGLRRFRQKRKGYFFSTSP